MGIKPFRKFSTFAAIAATVAATGAVGAAPLSIPDIPLFLSTAVQPNLIMAIDDSGSMDFEVLFPGNDGAAWWRGGSSSGNCSSATGNSFTGCVADGSTDQPGAGRLNFNNSGNSGTNWKKYSYLFPNGCNSADDSYQRRLCDSTNDHFAIPPLPAFAWSRSPQHNAAYFNPATKYEPWFSEGGYTFANAPITAARFDAVFGSNSNALDLTRDVAGSGQVDHTATCGNTTMAGANLAANYYFKVYTGMTIPEGMCIRSGTREWEKVRVGNCVIGTTNGCLTVKGATNQTFTLASGSDVAIRYFPATFYLNSGTALPSDFGYTAAAATGGLAPDGSSLLMYELLPANFASATQYQAAIQNFANWFSYSRKRHQALRAGLGASFKELSGMNVAGFTINNSGTNVTMRDIGVSSNKTALYTQFYHDWVQSGGTPNRDAVGNLIRNFRRTDATAPVKYSCQKNFGMLFTDGFSNPPASGDPFYSIGNIDSGKGAPFQDSTSNTMADGVMDGYLTPLRTGTSFPTGKVGVPSACDGPSPDPRLDCNKNLHMNFFAVTLGTRGLQFNPDIDQDPFVTTPTWPTTFPARHPSAVDDLWHSTINGRGELLNAKSPDEISQKLTSVLNTIIDRDASASSASSNTGTITGDTHVYQATFNSSTWTGQLFAYPITKTGVLGSPTWEASTKIPEPANRKIITVNSNDAAVPFTTAALDSTRLGQLDPTPAITATPAQVLDYIRGDSTNEGPAPDKLFRVRKSKLGDIIYSAPLFVGGDRPNFRYPDTMEGKAYSSFVKQDRDPIVYVGANDGMLHAFDANDGREIFAFIPSAVFGNLKALSSRTYAHQYFVDGSPGIGDAFFGGDWHRVLAGGLNKGGQAIYALDVSSTDNLADAETKAGQIVLWEFSDIDDADLGFTYSPPTIVKLHNDRWAAIFGNGFNNTANDAHRSSSGNAVLFIVDVETGALIKKIDTGMGTSRAPTGVTWDNGLASPAVVDVDGDRIYDYVYAGDLFGNLWKFNLTSANKSDWGIPYTDASSRPEPLFKARDGSNNAQPISTAPVVVRGPSGVGLAVLFGTGKYLEPSDRDSSTMRQSIYSIFDGDTNSNADVVNSRSELTAQQITHEIKNPFDSTDDVRLTTKNPIGSTRGWYLDLVSPVAGFQREKINVNPVVRNNTVHFTTTIPNTDPCSSGGDGWIMALDALSGGRPVDAQFDLNRDGKLDKTDRVKHPTENSDEYVSGVKKVNELSWGMPASPTILEGENAEGACVQFRLMPTTAGTMVQQAGTCGPGGEGRQSWRRVR